MQSFLTKSEILFLLVFIPAAGFAIDFGVGILVR